MGHETPWNRTATGEASPTSDPAAKSGQEAVGRRTCVKCFCEFSVPMVSGVPRQGPSRPAAPAHAWTTTQALPVPEAQTGKAASEGTPRCRLSDGYVDAPASGRGDRETFRRWVSSLPCLETPGKSGLELPETGAPSVAKKRKTDRPLEALPLAPDKKNPKNLGPIWSFWMNLAFCLFRTLPAPGPRKGKRPSCTISISKTEFLPSMPWWCLRNEDMWRSISNFADVISLAWMFELSSKTCSGTFEGQWSFFGIEERSTDVKKSSDGYLNIQDFIWNIFQPMHQNLTPLNMFGIRPITLSPTVHRGTWRTLTGCSETRYEGYGDPKNCFGPVSMLPIYHGHGEYFLYLCKTQ